MSILIKGIEMPDNCTDCWFRKMARHEYLADCILCPFTGDPTPYLTRDKYCPLVPIPPHGRLIDADALRAKMYHEAFETDSPMQRWDSGCWIRYKMFERVEESAPTIIPASEEGE